MDFSDHYIEITNILSVISFCTQEKDIPDPEIVKKLSDHFRKEKESAVRVIILSIFADIGLLREADSLVNLPQSLCYLRCLSECNHAL